MQEGASTGKTRGQKVSKVRLTVMTNQSLGTNSVLIFLRDTTPSNLITFY
jgi:hypothetical protein